MYISIEKIKEVFKKNLPVLSIVIDPEEIPLIFDSVSEILDLEARAIEDSYATVSISRLDSAAYEVFALAREIEEITG